MGPDDCPTAVNSKELKMSPVSIVEALRSIGEDLELRGIKTYRIKCEEDFFAVEGGYQTPPAATPVSLYYSPKDIAELDRKAVERHDYCSAARAFIYLPEILASVGAYVRDKGGSLASLSNMNSTTALAVVDVEYQTALGDVMFDRLTSSTIYELCVREHKRRSRLQNLKDHRFTRFSSLQSGL
jgi:hypothetical protein